MVTGINNAYQGYVSSTNTAQQNLISGLAAENVTAAENSRDEAQNQATELATALTDYYVAVAAITSEEYETVAFDWELTQDGANVMEGDDAVFELSLKNIGSIAGELAEGDTVSVDIVIGGSASPADYENFLTAMTNSVNSYNTAHGCNGW